MPLLQPGPTFGRSQAQERLMLLLADPSRPLITLTGPGGVGKTRLAQDAAGAASERGTPVIFCDLAPVARPEDAWAAVAAALGPVSEAFPAAPDPRSIAGELGEGLLLLVLDNAEHVLAGLGELGALLDAAPGLTVLATSRVPFGIPGEQIEPVPTLDLPPPDAIEPAEILRAPSVQLFAARAAAKDRTFAITDRNAQAVAGLCHRLDGLPLALELAAARITILPPAALLARIEQHHGLPATAANDVPGRQRTLQSTVDWSIALLDPDARAALSRLTVFRSPWTAEDAAAVAGSAPEAIASILEELVARSLLQPAALPTGEPAYRMLQTIRDVMLARLQQDAADYGLTLRRHAEWVRAEVDGLGLSTIVGDTLNNPTLEHIGSDLLAATDWLESTGHLEDAVALAVAASAFWHGPGRNERGMALLSRIPEVEAGWPAGFRGHAWYVLCLLQGALGRNDEALRSLEAARLAYREAGRSEPGVDHDRCYFVQLSGRYAEARDCFNGFVDAYRDSVPPGSLAIVWINLAEIEQLDPAPAPPLERSRRVRELFAQAQQDARVAESERNLRLAHASLAGELADTLGVADAVDSANDYAAAWSLLGESHGYFRTGSPRDQTLVVSAAARLCLPDAPRVAARLLGAATRLMDPARAQPGPVEARRLAFIRTAVEDALGPDAPQAIAEGARWSHADLFAALRDLIASGAPARS